MKKKSYKCTDGEGDVMNVYSYIDIVGFSVIEGGGECTVILSQESVVELIEDLKKLIV